MLRSPAGFLRSNAGGLSALRATTDGGYLGTPGPTVFDVNIGVGALHQDLPGAGTILGRDIGISSANGSNVLYAFGDTIIGGSPAPTPVVVTNGNPSLLYSTTAKGTTAAAPGSMTNFTETVDANNAPVEFIRPVLPFDTGTTDRHPHWPDSIIRHPSHGGWIVYYQRVWHRFIGGEHVFSNEAAFVADVPAGGTFVDRTGGNETLLWAGAGMTSGCCLAPDGYIYLFTTGTLATQHHKCARVLHANYKNLAAYQYWNGKAWSSTLGDAVDIKLGGTGYDRLGGMAGLTVSWNAHLGKFLMCHAHSFPRKTPPEPNTDVCLRTADAPQGPWSQPTRITVEPNPVDIYGIYTVREHAWATPDAGKTIYLTYAHALPSAFTGELRIARISLDDDAGPPTNVMTPPAEGWAVKISNDLAAGDVTLARGIYEMDFRPHPQNAGYRTCIAIPNGRTFDFSQAELRLKPGQSRMVATSGVDAGKTTGQLADFITNAGLSFTPASGITIVVGCLNGQAALQGAVGATNSEGANECWFDGIALFNPINCTITGSLSSPWARTVTTTRGDGATVNLDIRGVIKNIRGWDGSGGRTETFSYDFFLARTGNVAEYLETMEDDGSTRSSTGGSSNGMGASIARTSTTPILVTHRHIYGHHLRSHGATSYDTVGVARSFNYFTANSGSGFRYEYGWNHTADDVISRSNSNNGLNLKGEDTPPAGTTMLVTNRMTVVDNTNHAVQINSIVGATLRGWSRWNSAAGKLEIHFADQLYGSRASTGVTDLMSAAV